MSIRFKGPNSVDERRLQKYISSQPGIIWTAKRIGSDINSLYESGLVDEVRFLTNVEGESVKLIVEISSRPALGSIFFVGNSAFSDLKLAKVSGFNFEQKLTAAEIEAVRLKIEKFYHRSGYEDAKVLVWHQWNGKPIAGGYFSFRIDQGTFR